MIHSVFVPFLFIKTTHSLLSPHRLLFAFLLSCDVLISEGRLEAKSVQLLIELGGIMKQKGASSLHLPWLSQQTWTFFSDMEKTCQEFAGLSIVVYIQIFD